MIALENDAFVGLFGKKQPKPNQLFANRLGFFYLYRYPRKYGLTAKNGEIKHKRHGKEATNN